MNRAERAVLIAEQLKAKNAAADVCIVLGSGWNGVTDFLQDKKIIKYADLGGMPQCGVEGHEGNFVFGTVGECKVAAMQGRFHYYEGRSMDDIAVPLEALYVLGVRTLILTNSAGGIDKNYRPGDLMILRDHINFTGQNPLIGIKAAEKRPIFIDLSRLYDGELSDWLYACAQKCDLRAHFGTYAQMTGPSYETPAEIMMLRTLGASAVGMSTALEAIYAKYLGMRVTAVSCISNMAAGVTVSGLSHAEVLQTLKENGKKLSAFLKNVLKKL